MVAGSGSGKVVAGSGSGTADNSELIEELTREMLAAADALEFEKAAYLRDQLKKLRKKS